MAQNIVQLTVRDILIERANVERAIGRGATSVFTYQLKKIRGDALRKIGRVSKARNKQGRYKTQPRPPGQAPRARRKGNLRIILFRVDRKGSDVEGIVGPIFLGGRFGTTRGVRTVPETHEKGKKAPYRIRVKRRKKPMSRAAKQAFQNKFGNKHVRRKRKPRYVEGMTRYPKRPFMVPALQTISPRLAKMWKDQVK